MDGMDDRPLNAQDKINIHLPYELRSWARYFDVSPEKLKDAVWVVGPTAKDVKRYLRK